jgi:hypothetical protein
VILRRGAAGAGPSLVWPGIPLGSQRVFVPVDENGELWGTREHGRLFVQARRAHEPHEGSRGVRYDEMTVAELCRRLPAEAAAGLGLLGRPIDCADPTTLGRLPAQVDLRTFDRRSRVRPTDGTDWRLDASGPPLDGARFYDVVDTRAMVSAVVVIVDSADDDVVEAFQRQCAQGQIGSPLQLWEARNLPKWLQRVTRAE